MRRGDGDVLRPDLIGPKECTKKQSCFEGGGKSIFVAAKARKGKRLRNAVSFEKQTGGAISPGPGEFPH